MPDQTINILMYGMRRSGKSSVLASMIDSFREAARGTPLRVEPQSSTAKIMRSQLISLEKTFYNADYLGQSSFLFSGDSGDGGGDPSSEIRPYYFDLVYDDGEKKETIAQLNFWDVPGEIYHWQNHKDDSVRERAIQEIEEKMASCNILVVAVDTVHLMEENGKFSQAFHSPRILQNLISRCWTVEEGKVPAPKMVLFVPLKCERYYWLSKKDGALTKAEEPLTMDHVIERIKATFERPLQALKDSPYPVTVAITPILTMGSVEFDHFGRDDDGKIIREKIFGMEHSEKPARVYYRFTRDKNFHPLYCEQPVLYVLAFVVHSAKKLREIEKKRKKRSLLGIFAEGAAFWLIFSPGVAAIYLLGKLIFGNKKVMTAYDKISVKLKKTGDGYEILQNPLGL